MLLDNNLIYSLKNGYYSFKGALDTYGRMKILVFNTKKSEYFYTNIFHDSTKWISLGQFETVSKDLKKLENILKNLNYRKVA